MTKKEKVKLECMKRRKAKRAMLLDECQCSRNCKSLISSDVRQQFHDSFWKSTNYFERQSLILSHVMIKPIERRRGLSSIVRKTKTYCYTLPNDQGVDVAVCQAFFLNTFGYPRTNKY